MATSFSAGELNSVFQLRELIARMDTRAIVPPPTATAAAAATHHPQACPSTMAAGGVQVEASELGILDLDRSSLSIVFSLALSLHQAALRTAADQEQALALRRRDPRRWVACRGKQVSLLLRACL